MPGTSLKFCEKIPTERATANVSQDSTNKRTVSYKSPKHPSYTPIIQQWLFFVYKFLNLFKTFSKYSGKGLENSIYPPVLGCRNPT